MLKLLRLNRLFRDFALPDEVMKKYSSPRGSVMVQDPTTGAIMAMASSPSFDPNRYQDVALDRYLNPNIQEEYEPGSSMKAITMAAALDTGAVTPESDWDQSLAMT